jgi:hypothetical protein
VNKSESLKNLATALHKAQGQIKHAVKDAANPFFKSRYADLVSVWDAMRDAFQANGLSVSQMPDMDGENPVLVSILMHTSGEFLESRIKLNPAKNDPQGIGSCISYYRRYALQAIAGVCADDDDGEAAHGRTAKVDTGTGAVKTKKTALDDEQSAIIARLNKGILDYGGDEALKKSKAVQDAVAYNSGDDIVAAVQEYHDKVMAWANKRADQK